LDQEPVKASEDEAWDRNKIREHAKRVEKTVRVDKAIYGVSKIESVQV
jgi:hypothetical protein